MSKERRIDQAFRYTDGILWDLMAIETSYRKEDILESLGWYLRDRTHTLMPSGDDFYIGTKRAVSKENLSSLMDMAFYIYEENYEGLKEKARESSVLRWWPLEVVRESEYPFVRNTVNRIWSALLKEVTKYMERYLKGAHSSYGMTVEDVYQEAWVGLADAAERYTLGHKAKFKTFSRYYISGYAKNAFKDHANSVSIPSRYWDLYFSGDELPDHVEDAIKLAKPISLDDQPEWSDRLTYHEVLKDIPAGIEDSPELMDLLTSILSKEEIAVLVREGYLDINVPCMGPVRDE